MKYLLFNVVVVAALVYLFVGGGPTDPVEDWLPGTVNSVISDVRDRLSSHPSEETAGLIGPATGVQGSATPHVASDIPVPENPRTSAGTTTHEVAAVRSAPVVPDAPAMMAGKVENMASASPVAAAPPVIEVPERFAPPAILPQSIEATAPSPAQSAVSPSPQVEGELMSPRERRRELQRLAESMELFAVRKISR